jgi:hypothetical protein
MTRQVKLTIHNDARGATRHSVSKRVCHVTGDRVIIRSTIRDAIDGVDNGTTAIAIATIVGARAYRSIIVIINQDTTHGSIITCPNGIIIDSNGPCILLWNTRQVFVGRYQQPCLCVCVCVCVGRCIVIKSELLRRANAKVEQHMARMDGTRSIQRYTIYVYSLLPALSMEVIILATMSRMSSFHAMMTAAKNRNEG